MTSGPQPWASIGSGNMIYDMIDFIITICRDKMDFCSTKTMRGANCGTDHQMLRSRVIFSVRKNTIRKEL